jgi:serine protease Do
MINKSKILLLASIILISGFCAGIFLFESNFYFKKVTADVLRLDDQEATIQSIKKVDPAVVNIIVYDTEYLIDVNSLNSNSDLQKQKVEKGQGTGFIISTDGYILTNKHVVEAADEKTAEYRILLNTGKQYYAQLIGKDPLNDLAVLKIFDKNLPYVELGDSDKMQIGSTVIAIGNALGKYQNSATKGIISGLGRSLVASDQTGSKTEALDNIIQTDAEINQGNSGGPLIDLQGKVVGINVAMDSSGTDIGFAIPINDAKPVINSIKENGRIIRPMLGVRYMMITAQIAQDNKLTRNTGAWINSGDEKVAPVVTDSPADKAGLKDGDIIFEIDGVKLDGRKTLMSVLQKYKPGQKAGLKIQRGKEAFTKIVVLVEYKK